MKYFFVCICVLGIVFVFLFAEKKQEEDFVISITANSKTDRDENVMYLVRDYIIEKINNEKEIQEFLIENYDELKCDITKILVKNEMTYNSILKFDDSDLKIVLGEGEGNISKTNIKNMQNNLSNSVYISKIWEILGRIKG